MSETDSQDITYKTMLVLVGYTTCVRKNSSNYCISSNPNSANRYKDNSVNVDLHVLTNSFDTLSNLVDDTIVDTDQHILL